MKNIIFVLLIIFLNFTNFYSDTITLENQNVTEFQFKFCSIKWRDYTELLYSEAFAKATVLDKIIHGGNPVLSDMAKAKMNLLHLHSIDKKAAKNRISTSNNPIKEADVIISKAAEKYDVEKNLIKAIISTESDGNVSAVSKKNARGMMQIMPKTAIELGITDVFDPVENIYGGTRYYKYLEDYFRGNMKLALAAYNAGITNVIKAGHVIPNKITKKFVYDVLSQYERFNTNDDG